jgi:hypothetical protein
VVARAPELICPRPSDSSELELGPTIADDPQPTGEVVEQSGCHVFLDQQVAPLIYGRTLDAHPVDGQKVRFDFVA